MKTCLDCIPCFLSQSLEASRMTTTDEKIHREVLFEVMSFLQTISFEDTTPPEISREVHHIIRRITKSKDPYAGVKTQANETAEKLYPSLRKLVDESSDPLYMAVKLAIVGNVIDFGTMNRFNVEDMIKTSLSRELNKEDYSVFVSKLNEAKSILYVADNCGEIFFDKLLLEEFIKLGKKITYVVRANPIINDVTMVDAEYAGIHKLAEVIAGDAGNDRSAPGMPLHYVSKVFLDKIYSYDMVIAKGQGNYESLSEVDREIFFLLVVKCPLVARDIGVEVGKLVLKVKR